MSDVKENAVAEENKEWSASGFDSIWIALLLALCFGGCENSENPRISQLEKQVARLEGQMSMIGGKNL